MKKLNKKYCKSCPAAFQARLSYAGTTSTPQFFILVFITIFSFISSKSFSQTQDKKTLQNKYDKLQNEIKDTEDILSSTKKKKQNSLSEVKLLSRKINIRQESIQNISEQMSAVNKQMNETSATIKSMQSDLDELKTEYAKMIYYAYVNDKEYEPLHFLFASKSISDAFNEIQYIREYTAYRKQQTQAIKSVKDELQLRIDVLNQNKTEKQQLLTQEQIQKNKLDAEKKEKDKNLKLLQGEEKKLAEQIKKKKKDAGDLNKKIQNIIAEEIKKEKERAAAEAAKKKEAEKKTGTAGKTAETKTTEKKTEANKSVNLGLTPEMQLISKNFEGNKGKLPWPVERGTITETFGKRPHPVLKDVIVENNGVDIATPEGASVRSIFEGEVMNIIFNPSFQKGVIIKHGEYYTVYTNLNSVSVSPGDKISTKQKIGTVFTDDDKTEVHFELWKGTTLLDPSLWISKQ